jgi:hypothetical protein
MNTRQEQIVRDLENQFNQLNPIATGSSGLINVASIMSVVDASVNLKTEIELANKALIAGLQEQINADYERIKDDLDALGVAHALHKRGHVGELNQIRIGSKIGYLAGPYINDPSITIEYDVLSVNERRFRADILCSANRTTDFPYRATYRLVFLKTKTSMMW